ALRLVVELLVATVVELAVAVAGEGLRRRAGERAPATGTERRPTAETAGTQVRHARRGRGRRLLVERAHQVGEGVVGLLLRRLGLGRDGRRRRRRGDRCLRDRGGLHLLLLLLRRILARPRAGRDRSGEHRG